MQTHVTGWHDVKYWCTQVGLISKPAKEENVDKEDLSNYQKRNFSLPENLYNAYYNSHCIWIKILMQIYHFIINVKKP